MAATLFPAMKKVYLASASGVQDPGFIGRMRDVRGSVFSTSGIDPDPTCCTATSADLFAGIIDFWSEDLEVQIRIRAALRKPMVLFHPAGSCPSAVLRGLMRGSYPSSDPCRLFRPYASGLDVSDALLQELYPNGCGAREAFRVVC